MGKKSRGGCIANFMNSKKQDEDFTLKNDSERSTAENKGISATKKKVTLDMIPRLIEDIANCEETNSSTSTRALKMLFSLSENTASENQNRSLMPRQGDSQLVPELLRFLCRCERGSSEEYLALLVLNNISIPRENKYFVAIDCDSVNILSRLLCIDPSCHLVSIILVNLTFTDEELRKELLDPKRPIEMLEALVYVFKILTEEKYKSNPPIDPSVDIKNLSPLKLLSSLIEENKKQISKATDIDEEKSEDESSKQIFNPTNVRHDDTAKWCLSAIKNLSRSPTDIFAANAIVASGIVPLLLRIVTVGSDSEQNKPLPVGSNADEQSSSLNNDEVPDTTLEPVDNVISEDAGLSIEFRNEPFSWDANSLQDTALLILLNLAVISSVRSTLRAELAIPIIFQIAQYSSNTVKTRSITSHEECQMNFQCIKARMILALLVGSEGLLGKTFVKMNAVQSRKKISGSTMVMMGTEAAHLIEILGDCLHNRGKKGDGGYTAATFNIKTLLCVVHCLLFSDVNAKTLYAIGGMKINSLLMKAMALYSLQSEYSLDKDAAEHACCSLYLLSNFGFTGSFLPPHFSEEIVGKVLRNHLKHEVGSHAATQLQLRLSYLLFDGVLEESSIDPVSSKKDFELNAELLKSLKALDNEKNKIGTKPLESVFGRSVIRKNIVTDKDSKSDMWESKISIITFPNALIAACDLSRHIHEIYQTELPSDVFIANNIVKSADGNVAKTFNYHWIWVDEFDSTFRKLEEEKIEVPKGSKFQKMITSFRSKTIGDGSQPLSMFGCGCSDDFSKDIHS